MANETKEILEQLIVRNHQDFDINYNDYFANHLVHAICTLYSLGASKDIIENHYNLYSKKLVPLREPKFTITDENWETFICNKRSYAELIVYFREQLKSLGIQKSLDKFMPRLLLGLIGAAFHPLIQIGYGIEYNFPQVVAEGLAFACKNYNNIGEVLNRLPNDAFQTSINATALEIVRKFQNLKIPAPNEDRKRFPVERILIKHEGTLIDLTCQWKFKDFTTKEIMTKLDELTLACIHVFFGSYNQKTLDFFLAHSFTALHATRILLPHLSFENQKKLLQINLIGLLGNYWFQGSPEFHEKNILEYNSGIQLNWESIIKTVVSRANNSDEQHVMKVIRTLLVIKDNVDKNLISDELLLKSGEIMVNSVQRDDEWAHNGIGRN